MITLNGVSKKLGKFNIKDISIEIPDGYICGLAGQNGAGKTSLMHMILGLYKPDAGEVLVDGKSYSENEEEIRKLFGIVLISKKLLCQNIYKLLAKRLLLQVIILKL